VPKGKVYGLKPSLGVEIDVEDSVEQLIASR
jgi:hypothetical protein